MRLVCFEGVGMGRYRKVEVSMWADDKFISLSKPQPNAQSLWMYLLTGPCTTSLPGLIRIGEAGLAEEIGWPLKAFREAFEEVLSKGMAKADWEARVVWLPKAITHNPPQSPNVVTSWAEFWSYIPDQCHLKTEAFYVLKAFMEGLGEAFQGAFRKACRKPMPNQEQEQEQEKRYMVRAAPEAKPDDCHFDAFWQSYPRKVAKDGARKAWAKIRPDEPTVAAIFSALEWQRESEGWRKNGGQFVPHPSTWLNNRRWEDERPANGPDEEPDPYRDFRKVVPCHNPNCPEPPDMRAHWEGDVCPGSEQHA